MDTLIAEKKIFKHDAYFFILSIKENNLLNQEKVVKSKKIKIINENLQYFYSVSDGKSLNVSVR